MQTDQFYAFMERYVEFMEELANSSSEKYSALISYDARKADRAVSHQQAMNMQLNQFEEQREAEQENAGFGGLTFHQILDKLDSEHQKQFRALFGRFEDAVNNVKFYNKKSMAFAEEGLRMLGAAGANRQVGTYSANGKRPAGISGSGLFETKI